ncbi:MAG: hypothetical protein HZA59_12535 [Hydrogenophilales bacterium]|nr:hypothetical protein [Hydrogenophilales bacterium]
MKFPWATLLALSLVLIGAQPVAASVISDGSSGVFRPISDFTLDLSGFTVPQYSSIYIDAGIKLAILTPTSGAFGDLLAANDIFVDGIIDAGSGSLGLMAGNQIELRAGSQIIAGSLNLFAGSLNLSGDLILRSSPFFDHPGGGLKSGDISLAPGGDLTLRAGPSGGLRLNTVPVPSTILLLLPGLILLARGSWRRAP